MECPNYLEFDKGLIYKGNLIEVKKIVVHNSASAGNAYSSANYNYHQTKILNKNTGFAHYYVDDKQVIMLARENRLAWHSGKKEYNDISIGIEICANPMKCLTKCTEFGVCPGVGVTKFCDNTAVQKFIKAEKNALDLVYYLMYKWSLTEVDVLFHSDVKNTQCPFFTKKLHKLTKGSDFVQGLDSL